MNQKETLIKKVQRGKVKNPGPVKQLIKKLERREAWNKNLAR